MEETRAHLIPIIKFFEKKLPLGKEGVGKVNEMAEMMVLNAKEKVYARLPSTQTPAPARALSSEDQYLWTPSSTLTDGEESAPEGDNFADDTTDVESNNNAEIASESLGVVSEISEQTSADYGSDATAAPLLQLTSFETSEEMSSSSVLGKEQQLTVNTESLDAILINSSEDILVAGINQPILLLIQSLIDLSFRQEPNDLYHNLKKVAFGFISVLSEIPKLSKLFALFVAAESNREAADMESIAGMGSSTGIGSIIAFCEVNDSVEDGSQPPERVPDWLFEVKAAIYRAKNSCNDEDIKDEVYLSKHEVVEDITGISRDVIDNEVTNDGVRSFIDGKVSNGCVKDHLGMDFETRNLLRHALDLYFGTTLLRKMTVADIFRFLSKSSDLIEEVKEFARRSNRTVEVDEENMSALDFLFIFVLPAFERDELLNDAWKVGCLILCHLNQITSVGNKASSDAKANDPRKKFFRHEQRKVECESFDGLPDESAAVFWSGVGDTFNKRRSSSIRITAVFLFRKFIEKRLPSTFSFKFGFTRSFLRLSASSIRTDCVFIKPDIFSNCQDCMKKRIENMMKALKNKDETGGERRTIFIRDDKQRKSLKLLLDTYDRLASTSSTNITV